MTDTEYYSALSLLYTHLSALANNLEYLGIAAHAPTLGIHPHTERFIRGNLREIETFLNPVLRSPEDDY